MKNLKSFLVLILLSMVLSACVGPPKDDKCIPADGTTAGTTTDSPGVGTNGSFAQTVDDMLKNGHIISTIVSQIKTELVGQDGSFSSSQSIFEGFVNSVAYQTAISAAFALFVIIYGMSVTFGMVQVSLGDAAIRVAKIGGIAAIGMNWGIFYQTVGGFFIEGTDELIKYFMGNFSCLYSVGDTCSAVSDSNLGSYADPGSQIFNQYDTLIANIFSFQTFAFVSAMFHAGAYAPVYAIFLIMALYWVLQAVLEVVRIYVFSLFAKALLFALAPVFLAFLLFQQTKPMFEAWLKQLVSFSLQPILITAYIGLFGNLLKPFFDQFTQYKMCWLRLDNTSDKWGWQFVNSSNDDPIEFGSSSAPPINLQTVLLFMFFTWLFKTALTMTEQLTTAIVQTGGGSLANIQGMQAFTRGIDGGGGGGGGGAAQNIANQAAQKATK